MVKKGTCKKTSDVKRGINYEKQKASSHNAKHVGGPGKHDYQRGTVKGEVKNWNKPVTKPVVQEAAKKGITEFVSKNGFTKPACEYRDRYRPNMKLYHKDKRV